MRRVVLLPCKVSHQFLSSAFGIDEIGLNQTDRLDVRQERIQLLTPTWSFPFLNLFPQLCPITTQRDLLSIMVMNHVIRMTLQQVDMFG